MTGKPPRWTPKVIEGGKQDLPSATKPSEAPPLKQVPETGMNELTIEKRERESVYEMMQEGDLIRLYLELSRKPPANFSTSVRPELVQNATKILPQWTVKALHDYLSENTIWVRPSFTKAVFEEIRARMLRGDMSPREPIQ